MPESSCRVTFSASPGRGRVPGGCGMKLAAAAGPAVMSVLLAGLAVPVAGAGARAAAGQAWQAAQAPLPADAATQPDAGLDAVACPSATVCVADGAYTDSSGNAQGLLLTGSGGAWTAV